MISQLEGDAGHGDVVKKCPVQEDTVSEDTMRKDTVQESRASEGPVQGDLDFESPTLHPNNMLCLKQRDIFRNVGLQKTETLNCFFQPGKRTDTAWMTVDRY